MNWRDLTFKNSAEEDHAYVSVYGGTNKVKYYTHIDYTDVRGAFKDTKQPDYNTQLRQSKANIRANLDFNITNTTLMSVNLFGMFQETKRPSDISADDATAAIYNLPASAFPTRPQQVSGEVTRHTVMPTPLPRFRSLVSTRPINVSYG